MRSKSILVTAMSVCMCALPVFGYFDLNDQGTHYITYSINDTVRVDWPGYVPDMWTTVNISDGIISGQFLAYYESHINMSGGTIAGAYFSAEGWSHVNISGGTISNGLFAHSSSQTYISDGSIGVLKIYEEGQVELSGGTIREDIQLDGNGLLTIKGSNFTVDGQSVGSGELTSILGGYYGNETLRHLTGTLENGNVLDNDFRIGSQSSIILIPEPATLLLLSLGGLILRRRKQL